MDDKKFEEILTQYAEIKERRPVKSAGFRVDENSGGEVIWRGQVIAVNEKENPTLNYEIKKLKPIKKPCGLGCGDEVIDQIIEYRKNNFPETHWRTKCSVCKLYVSPDGNGFVDGHTVNEVYRRHFLAEKNKKE